MLSTKKIQKVTAARAQAAKSQKRKVQALETPSDSANEPSESGVESDCELTGWTGGVKQAQIQVKAFSSRWYTSHRRVPERVAAHFDT
jgi:hypothetical protein